MTKHTKLQNKFKRTDILRRADRTKLTKLQNKLKRNRHILRRADRTEQAKLPNILRRADTYCEGQTGLNMLNYLIY